MLALHTQISSHDDTVSMLNIENQLHRKPISCEESREGDGKRYALGIDSRTHNRVDKTPFKKRHKTLSDGCIDTSAST